MVEKLGWGQDRKRTLANAAIVSVVAAHQAPRIIADPILLDQIGTCFENAVRKNDRLAALSRQLDVRGLQYCVFGGWLRDTIDDLQSATAAGPPRDIDLVVRDVEVGDLLGMLPADVRPTMFGGVQSGTGSSAFDIWPLHETFLIKHLRLEPTFENLLKSADFTINAGLFFPPRRAAPSRFMDGGMLEALRTRTLDFNYPSLPFPVMQCARLAAYAGKLSLGLSPAVQDFMRAIIRIPSQRERVLLGLRQTYPPPVVEAAERILNGLTEAPR
ncbi:hypothetical protein [Bradyrhizobium tunisiense]|uniref:hypothetical protein n=1 Tax=Bradyrhizobium tunisiense TaxID=3278709 RepID=UPI0035DC7635